MSSSCVSRTFPGILTGKQKVLPSRPFRVSLTGRSLDSIFMCSLTGPFGNFVCLDVSGRGPLRDEINRPLPETHTHMYICVRTTHGYFWVVGEE